MADPDGHPVEGEAQDLEMSAPSFPDAEFVSDVGVQADAEKKNDGPGFFLDLLGLAAKAILVAVVIKLLLVQVFWIPSESMYDTLEVGDRVAVNKLAYRFGSVGRGNVVVFDLEPRAAESLPSAAVRTVAEAVGLRTPQSDLIKRVIALPGESIEVRDNTVFIDGVALVEPYAIWDGANPVFGPEVIPEGTVFVMGDNRSHSRDSRIFGPIPQDRIIGRAFVVLWPVANWSGL